ncbi:MAG: S8 family peptidase, partial [Sphingorhabdus sp.]
CGGGGVNPTPPPPPPTANFDTVEYQRSNGAVQARAIAAYNAGASGAGIIAGVVDSGIDEDSPEFAGRIHPLSADFAGSRGLQDEGGHGTAVSAVLLAAKNDSDMHGVAFASTLLVLRTDTAGTCTDPDPEKGCTHSDNNMARALDRAVSAGAKVVNFSLGGSPANFNLRAAIDRATAAGVVLVFSAGNDFDTQPETAINPDELAMIALDPVARGQIIIAGATDSNRTISAFSNRAGTGASSYLTALGVRVRAPDETGAAFFWSGTSFSAPVISGAVALLAQAFPNLTGRQIVDLLLRTADDLGDTGTDAVYGRGELNLSRAFAPQGQTSLASTMIAVSINVATGALSAPMGDATRAGGPKTVVLDSYGRAFDVDFSGSLAAAPAAPTLAPALAIGTHTRVAVGGTLSVALSVTDRVGSVSLDQLDLSQSDRQQVRAIAASVIAKLQHDKTVAFGIGRSSSALIDQMSLERASGFVAADAAQSDFGFHMRPKSAFAYRQALGPVGIYTGYEIGDARIWRDRIGIATQQDFQNHRYSLTKVGIERQIGKAKVTLGGTYLIEDASILGAAGNIWTGETGSKSWFSDAKLEFGIAKGWQLSGTYRRGWTRIRAAGLRQNADWLRTEATSIDLTRFGVFSLRDQLALRISQPLRVTSGGINVTLPDSYDYASLSADFGDQYISLAPTGQERDLELSYASSLWGGQFGGNLYWRHEPGNIADAAADVGIALRFSRAF